MTSTALTDEAIEDAKRDPRDRKDIVKARLIGFHSWLLNNYAVYSRGSEKKTPHQMVGKGLREKQPIPLLVRYVASTQPMTSP